MRNHRKAHRARHAKPAVWPWRSKPRQPRNLRRCPADEIPFTTVTHAPHAPLACLMPSGVSGRTRNCPDPIRHMNFCRWRAVSRPGAHIWFPGSSRGAELHIAFARERRAARRRDGRDLWFAPRRQRFPDRDPAEIRGRLQPGRSGPPQPAPPRAAAAWPRRALLSNKISRKKPNKDHFSGLPNFRYRLSRFNGTIRAERRTRREQDRPIVGQYVI